MSQTFQKIALLGGELFLRNDAFVARALELFDAAENVAVGPGRLNVDWLLCVQVSPGSDANSLLRMSETGAEPKI